MNILLTSTSFQDTPGKHQDLLNSKGFELTKMRGPLKAEELLPIIDQFDGIICSDDEYTDEVISKGASGRLKIISKYGVGLDQIDLNAAEKYGVKVTNCPSVNQVSVAEHVLALMFSFYRNIHIEHNITQKGGWERLAGHEVRGKRIGILGFGSVGREAAKLSKALGLEVKAYDKYMDKEFAENNGIKVANSLDELVSEVDIISVHLPLNEDTKGIINSDLFSTNGVNDLLLINTARADLIDYKVLESGLKNGTLIGYCTDVMYTEPMDPNHPLKDFNNVLITPHIGSRTFQSVERQGAMAVQNLMDHLLSFTR